jgi:signal transduction histidine kinase
LGAELAGNTVLLGDLAGAEAAVYSWQADAATPEISLMGRGDASAAIAIEARGIGKEHFDIVRARLATLQTGINGTFSKARTRSLALQADLTRLLFVALGLLALSVSLLVLLQWRWVLKPLRRIRDAAGAVSGGALDETVPAVGPPELAALGADVERMRARMVAEIRFAQDAYSELHRAHLLSERAETLRQLNAQLETVNAVVLKNSLDLEAGNAQLVAANLELEQFSYSVSHDLRAPLRAIVGFTRILTDEHSGSLDSEALRYLGIVCDGARRMDALINDLLAFSRVTRSNLERVDVPIGELVDSVWPEVNASSPTRYTLTVLAAGVVRADPVLLRQVLANLLANAVKFSAGRDPATIMVECGPDPEGTGQTLITVRDNGVGFDPKYADRMFEVFQRLHRTDEFEGTGIGLSIVKRHGGRVGATATLDEGAAFSFTLGPLSVADDSLRPAMDLTGNPTTGDATPESRPSDRPDGIEMVGILAGFGAVGPTRSGSGQ